MEEILKQILLKRGFTEETLLNNRGLTGAVIDEIHPLIGNPHTGKIHLVDARSWVAVSEHLPKIGDRTDIFISAGYRVTNYKWEDYDLETRFYPHEITHWITIPEPPCI